MLIAVDDAHWADSSSLRFLAYLAARCEELGVLVVLTAREGEQTAVADVIAALRSDARAVRVAPGALSEDAVATMVRSALGDRADAVVLLRLRAGQRRQPVPVARADLRARGRARPAGPGQRCPGRGRAPGLGGARGRGPAGPPRRRRQQPGQSPWPCSRPAPLRQAAPLAEHRPGARRAGRRPADARLRSSRPRRRWRSYIRCCAAPSTRESSPPRAPTAIAAPGCCSRQRARAARSQPGICCAASRPTTRPSWLPCGTPPARRWPTARRRRPSACCGVP